jgi:hypothetical protein
MHTDALWPIHGRYLCKRCLRERAVEWEGRATPAEYGELPAEDPRVEIDAPVWLAGQR